MSKKVDLDEILAKAMERIEEDRTEIKDKMEELGEEWALSKTSAAAMVDLLEGLQRGNEQLIKIAAVILKKEPEKVTETKNVLDLLKEVNTPSIREIN